MSRFFKTLHKGLCLGLSATLFFEAPLWAAPLAPAAIPNNRTLVQNTKRFLNDTKMGKAQTLKEWWQKAKPLIDKRSQRVLEPLVQAHGNEKLPAMTAIINGSKPSKQTVTLSFKTADNKKHRIILKPSGNGPIVSVDQKDYSAQQLVQKAQQFGPQSHSPFLSWAEFERRALNDYKWGIKYMKALQAFVVAAEKNQFLLHRPNPSKTSFYFQLLIPNAEAANGACILGGHVTYTYDQNTGNCGVEEGRPTTKFQCPGGNRNQIDCNPTVFGFDTSSEKPKPYCVDRADKTKVTASCAENSGFKNLKTKDDLKRHIDKIGKYQRIGDPADSIQANDTKAGERPFEEQISAMKHILNDYIDACLVEPQNTLAKTDSSKLKNIDESEINGFSKLPKDKHNRIACAEVLRPLAFLDEIANENNDSKTTAPPPPAAGADDCVELTCNPGTHDAICESNKKPATQCAGKSNQYKCDDGTKPTCGVKNPESPVAGALAGEASAEEEKGIGNCWGTSMWLCGGVGLALLAAFAALGLAASTEDGKDGKIGPAGTNGIDGKDGVQGPKGDKGDKGDPAVTPDPTPTQEPQCDRTTGAGCTGQ